MLRVIELCLFILFIMKCIWMRGFFFVLILFLENMIVLLFIWIFIFGFCEKILLDFYGKVFWNFFKVLKIRV